MNNKFLLNDIYESEKINSVKLSYLPGFVHLCNNGLASFSDYFIDSQCGFCIIDVSDYYFVELYTTKVSKNLSFLLYNDFLDKYDPMNMYNIFFKNAHEVKVNPKGSLCLDIIYINKRLTFLSLAFPKAKFSKSECEYWANMSLKNWIYFITESNACLDQKKIIDDIDEELYYFKTTIDEKRFKRFLQNIDKNAISFTLEAILEFLNNAKQIQKEIKSVLKQSNKYNKKA